MSASTKRHVIVLISLLITGIFTFGAYTNKNYSGDLYTQKIPVIIEDWHGKDLPLDESTFEILETKDVLMRKYTNSNGDAALLTVTFSKDNRKIAHPPEVCLAGGGWERMDRYTHEIQMGNENMNFNTLILQKGNDRQVVLYLYKAGDKLTSNYYTQQFNIMLNGMLRKNTSSALIRISSITTNDDIDSTVAFLDKFAAATIPVLEESLP